jgi:hypothetical protein
MSRSVVMMIVVGMSVVVASRLEAGAPPACDVAYTPAARVAAAPHVVVVRAVSATRSTSKKGGDGLRTKLRVVSALKGDLVPGTLITVRDCTHWKCPNERFARGEQALLFLRGDGAGYWIDEVSCHGEPGDLTTGRLTHDPTSPTIRAIYAAAGVALLR